MDTAVKLPGNEEKMDNRSKLKLKKYNMILWSFLGGVSFIILVFTILSLSGVMDVIFSPVMGIALPAIMVVCACSQIRSYFVETMITYETAKEGAQDEVMCLFEAVKKNMAEQGIDQWDEVYPDVRDVVSDIQDGTLTLVRQGGRLVAVYTLNRHQDNAYKFGSFKDTSDGYLVLHRLCVHPDNQHTGIAVAALKHIEEEAKKEGVSSIRLDVFTKNLRAVKLYEQAGYEYAGDAYFRKGKFALMEKLLGGKAAE